MGKRTTKYPSHEIQPDEQTKKIPLNGKRGAGKFALVDAEDYEWLSQYRWYLTPTGYASISTSDNKHPFSTRAMHRIIVSAPKGRDVDHINHNTLDNRKANLRVVTHQKNMWNMKRWRQSESSRYKGVSYDEKRDAWVASINPNGESIYLGGFMSENEAAEAYNQKAIEMYGEHAHLNRIHAKDRVTKRRADPWGDNPYRGVTKVRGRWHAALTDDDKKLCLGGYPFPHMAARVYDAYALRKYGQSALMNFPQFRDCPIDIDSPIIIKAHKRNNARAKIQSGYYGVYPNKKRWMGRIGWDGKFLHLGTFDAPEEAARAYDKAALDRGGSVIELNFPEGHYNYLSEDLPE